MDIKSLKKEKDVLLEIPILNDEQEKRKNWLKKMLIYYII